MFLTISDLLPFLSCKYKGMTRLKERRWTSPTQPMHFGTAIHDELASWHGRGTVKSTLQRASESGNSEQFTRIISHALDLKAKAVAPFDRLSTSGGARIRHAEYPMALQLSDKHVLLTRVDYLYRTDNVGTFSTEPRIYWSGQFKTLGKGRSLGRYLEEVRMSPHEIAYRTSMRRTLLNHTVAGTHLTSIRTYLTKQQLADGAPLIETFHLEATKEEDDAAFEDIRQDLLDLAAAVEAGTARRAWSSCFSSFGACPLLQHCHNGGSVQDSLPEPVTMRYADIVGYPIALLDGTTRRFVNSDFAQYGSSAGQSA